MEESDNSRNKAQEFNDRLKALSEELELKDKQTIIGIDFKDNIQLGGNLERNSVFVIKIKDEDGTVHHIVVDKDVNQIATIDKEGKIELSDRERQIWEQFIGTKENQRPDQKNIYDFDKDYILEEYKTNEHDKENDAKETVGEQTSANNEKRKPQKDKPKENKTKEEQEAAKSLNIEAEAVICIIKIEDRKAFGQAIGKDLEETAYIVKYGNNKVKIMESNSDGKFKEVLGFEYSEFSSEVLEQLNMPEHGNDLKIRAGDINTIKDDSRGCTYTIIRESDPEKGIVVINTPDGDIETYAFDDKDKDTLEELETSIVYAMENGDYEPEKEEEEQEEEEKEKDDDEDEGRTPWGDAYSRQHR